MTDTKSKFEVAYDALKLWGGDPKTRIPKLLILAGLPMVASPWWQPLVNGLAVKYLHVSQELLDAAETSLVASGWTLVVIGVLLYLRATRSLQSSQLSGAATESTELSLPKNIHPDVQRNALTALGQLCTAAIDVPRVHLEGMAAEKQAETDARVRLIERNSEELASDMAIPPEYAQQAVRKFGERIIQEQINLDQVGSNAAEQIGLDAEASERSPDEGGDVPPINPDWLNQFEQEARNVSTEEMQLIFGRILASEIQQPESFSIKAVKLVRELDSRTAALFRLFCSCCISLRAGQHLLDARVPSLGGNAASNSLQSHGITFEHLNVLQEHGLIIADYNSQMGYEMCIARNGTVPIGFTHQNRLWGLIPDEDRPADQKLPISGVMLTRVGKELLPIVDVQPSPNYTQALAEFFVKQKLKMIPVQPPAS